MADQDKKTIEEMTPDINSEMMTRFFQKEYSEDDLVSINKWLSESEENRREFFLLEMAFNSGKLERYSDEQFIKKSKEALDRKLNEYESKRVKKIRISRTFKYVAILAVVIGLFSIILTRTNPFDDMITVVADTGVKEVLLEDGTKVWLNKDAVFKYPKQFDGDTRKVELEGEGYFEVAKNADCPFIVNTEALQVKVLGTAFNLSVVKDSELATALLIEGSVEVKSNINEGLVVLSPGQKAELNKRTGQLSVSQNNTQEGVAWHEHIITFESATVSEIMKKLESVYNVKIIISPDTSNATYSGVLRNYKDINLTLKSLSNSVPIKYKVDGNNVYISD